MLPGDAATGMPPYAELDHAAFWATVERGAPPLLQLGLRAATWALTFSPAWLRGTPRTFDALSADEQDALLQAAAAHEAYAVRQLIMMVKTLACLAYFEQPSVRERVELGARS